MKPRISYLLLLTFLATQLSAEDLLVEVNKDATSTETVNADISAPEEEVVTEDIHQNIDIMKVVREIIKPKDPNDNLNDKFKETMDTFKKGNNVVTKLILSDQEIEMIGPSKSNIEKISSNNNKKYEPTWESIDARPLPSWYDEAKIGIFIHWGVFSVPSFRSEWFWDIWGRNGTNSVKRFMADNYPPNFTYQDFAKDFTAEFFNPDRWADIIASSGAKYVVLTSKHHEGYTMWPSHYSYSWNSMDVGPKRDLVGDLAKSIRKRHKDIRFGLYHSLYEWFNPLYVRDRANNWTTDDFTLMKTLPELIELVYQYKPEVIWSDGEWEAPETYWKSREFLAWLYNESPVKDSVVVNDRWCNTCLCKHGGYLTCEDRFQPSHTLARKFENCFTIDKGSWGYRREANLSEYYTTTEMISTVMNTLSFGGNVLINVGPTKEGTISPLFEERLKELGEFLKVNGEAVYGSHPWTKCQNETNNNGTTYAWYTTKVENNNGEEGAIDTNSTSLFLTFISWPRDEILSINCVQMINSAAPASIYLLGYDDQQYSKPLPWHQVVDGPLHIILPKKSLATSERAWTIKWSLK